MDHGRAALNHDASGVPLVSARGTQVIRCQTQNSNRHRLQNTQHNTSVLSTYIRMYVGIYVMDKMKKMRSVSLKGTYVRMCNHGTHASITGVGCNELMYKHIRMYICTYIYLSMYKYVCENIRKNIISK